MLPAGICLGGGALLAGMSRHYTASARDKRLQAARVEAAPSATPEQLREMAAEGRPRPHRPFEEYVALEGAIGAHDVVTAPGRDAAGGDVKAGGGLDAVYLSQTLRDRIYECRFARDTSRSGGGRGRNARDATPGRPRGKIKCRERWATTRNLVEHTDLQRGGLFIESLPRLTTEAEVEGTSVDLVGVTVGGLRDAARMIFEEFTPAHPDRSALQSLKSQHKMLVLQAAGEDILLEERSPVTLGTKEKVRAVLVGDRLTCLGVARLDPDGRLSIRPDLEAGGSNGSNGNKSLRPFYLSRMSKMEIGSDLRAQAQSTETAAWIFGVSAGGLLATGAALGVVAGVKRFN